MVHTATTSNLLGPHGRVRGLPDHLVIRQMYLGCLSQASYLIGDRSTGRAVVVDPRRDVDEILAAASEDGLTIDWVIETHFHADFLSGHLEVVAATGATIGIGSRGTTEFDSNPLSDGEVIELGRVEVEVLHTPGHTPESISLVVSPSADAEPVAVLTGDTLFIGDVGRPDLLASVGVTAEELGSHLYRSVNRLLEFPDATLVLPAHGAGSACGKALSTETISTIGIQRATNYALQPMAEQRFIDLVTEGQPTAPGYFGYDASLNRQDRALLDEHELPPVLALADVTSVVEDGAVALDTRRPEDFAAGHLAGSINVSLDGRFSEQVGSVIAVGVPIVLVDDADHALEAKVRLARIGFDHVVGVLVDLEPALAAVPSRAAHLSRLTATELEARRSELGDRLQLVDVRNPAEVEAAPLDGARNIPLPKLRDEMSDLDQAGPVVLVCAGGARSVIANSLLRANGFDDVSDVIGGANAMGLTATCSTVVGRPAALPPA